MKTQTIKKTKRAETAFTTKTTKYKPLKVLTCLFWIGLNHIVVTKQYNTF